MHDLFTVRDLIELTSEFEGSDSIRTKNGSYFIRRLGDHGSDAYLHRLFAPCTPGDIRDMEAFFGHTVPDSYASFLQFSNGAFLFDSTFYIYGWNVQLDRSGNPEKMSALSVANETRYYRSRTGERTSLCTGSISGNTKKYTIIIDVNNEVLLCNDDGIGKPFGSFLECVYQVSTGLRSVTDENGLIDVSGTGVEAMMDSFFQYPN